MKIFEGKSPSERKKIIAAMALGALALLTLTYTFGGMFFGGGRKTTVTVNVSPTPTATVSSSTGTQNSTIQALSPTQINGEWLTTPVTYYPSSFYAPDAGRNIFAFYEPPAPTPFVIVEKTPTPMPTPTITPPPPPPPILVSYVSPQNVFAGSKSFRLEVNGDKFTPESLIYINGSQIPTNFVSAQKLTADISSTLITGEGQRQIEVRTPDGKLYSNLVSMVVQAPPKPNYQYIGLIARRRSNNDTATLIEPSKTNALPFNMRLNDVVGRFRMVSISEKEVVMEDTSLGFRHRLPMARPNGGGQVTTQPARGGFDRNTTPGRFPTDGTTVVPYNPTLPSTQEIPGIPNNIPRYVPPTPQQQQQQKKDDEDDEDGDN
jgi:hypothetical protein